MRYVISIAMGGIAATLIIVASVVLQGCSATGLQTASDAAAVDRAMNRASMLVERYSDRLEEAEANEVQDAWAQLQAAHQGIKSPDADLAWHYESARDAYIRLRDVARNHWGALPDREREWAQEIHERATRLDAEVGRYESRVRDVLELAAGTVRLLIYAGVL